MLWTIIRDFFVQYIFGGIDSNLEYWGGSIGQLFSSSGNYLYNEPSVYDTYIYMGDNCFWVDGFDDYFQSITIGDYLSTTATIIVISLLCVAMAFAVVWLFKTIYRLVIKWAL